MQQPEKHGAGEQQKAGSVRKPRSERERGAEYNARDDCNGAGYWNDRRVCLHLYIRGRHDITAGEEAGRSVWAVVESH